MKTRLLLIIFSLFVVCGFSYSLLKAEDLKEKELLLQNIALENEDYAKYRHQLIDDADTKKEQYRKEMEINKQQYFDLLNKQEVAIKQHTKQVAVVSKRLVASNGKVSSTSGASNSSKNTTSSSSSTTKTNSSSSSSTSSSSNTSKPKPARSTASS